MCSFLAVLALVPLPTGAKQKDAPKESELEGKWIVVSFVEGGMELKNVAGTKVVIEGDRLKQDGNPEKLKFRLDPTTKPKQIDITAEDSKEILKGIYAIEGESLKICYDMAGKGRPAEFASKAGTRISLRTLKRDKK
jgi:uncharacterized protein (TIGR03067 family)